MAFVKRFAAVLPDDFLFLEQAVEVAGVSRHRRAALAFAAGTHQELLLEPVKAEKPDDPVAVRVIGSFKGNFFRRKKELGNLPEEFARRLLKGDLLAIVIPHLRRVFVTELKDVHVEFDLVGPKAAAANYRRS